MVEFKVWVGDDLARDQKIKELAKEFYATGCSYQIITPGNDGPKSENMSMRKDSSGEYKTKISNFSYDFLREIFSMVGCIAICDAHRLSPTDADNLMEFYRQHSVSIHLVSAHKNERGGNYAILDHLADAGMSIEILTNIGMETPAVEKGAESKKAKPKQKKGAAEKPGPAPLFQYIERKSLEMMDDYDLLTEKQQDAVFKSAVAIAKQMRSLKLKIARAARQRLKS